MKGVSYVMDEKGEPQAVLIDLARHRRIWEDFQDLLVSRSRRKEPRESLADVEVERIFPAIRKLADITHGRRDAGSSVASKRPIAFALAITA
ncbi:MAG TPA: hypothetical protein VNH11_17795 [Pirellulales bacterium]|nr:hypothetical protein [Pirellulales bacterium]